jgi:asparagine synthase (glutamine-hydrolysing)
VAVALGQAANTYAEERRGDRLSFTAFKQAPWYMTSKFAIERSVVTYRTPYFDNELVKIAYQAPEELTKSSDVSLLLIADGNPALRDVGTDRALVHQATPLLTPLRHSWQEFTFKAEYAYDYGMPQWLATTDHLLARLRLERIFLGRHKFHHFRVWYRDELAGYLRDVLLDTRSLQRPYVRRPILERMVHGHTSGHNNFTLEFHRILACELIQRQLIDGS